VEAEDEKRGDFLGGGTPASGHRCVVAPRHERLRAQLEAEREMLDDLGGSSFPCRRLLPLAVTTPIQRAEHQFPQFIEAAHCLKNRRRT